MLTSQKTYLGIQTSIYRDGGLFISGDPQVGGVLTANNATAVQWMADGVDISGANALTKTVLAGEVGKRITARSTSGTIETSNALTAIAAVTAPAVTLPPLIVGTPKVGTPLAINDATFSGSASTVIRTIYSRGNHVVAVGATYTPTENDVGRIFYVVDQATNAAGTVRAVSPFALTVAGVTPPLLTNEGAILWQSSPGFSSPRTVYNGNNLDLIADNETNVYGTGHLVFAVDFEPDAIQFVGANMHNANPRVIEGWSAVCPSTLSGDMRYDPLFATAPIAAGLTVPPYPTGATSASLAVNPTWYPLSAGTEIAGVGYVIAIRECAFYPASVPGTSPPQNTNPATYPSPYFLHSGTGWADTSQKFWYMGVAVKGNKLNSALGASPTGTGNCPIIAVRIRSKNGLIRTVAVNGSSEVKEDLDSALPRKGGGWPITSAAAVSTKAKPVLFMNMGQAGQSLDKCLIAAQSTIPVLRPTDVIIEFANTNNFSQVTTNTINTARSQLDAIIAINEQYGARTLFWDSYERNTQTSPYLAPFYDQTQWDLLNAYVAEQSARYPTMATRADTVSVTPRAAKMIGNGDAYDALTDGIHPSTTLRNTVTVPKAIALLTAQVVNKWQ